MESLKRRENACDWSGMMMESESVSRTLPLHDAAHGTNAAAMQWYRKPEDAL
jgi:hypothetical protein